jgi:hypothetical protein
MTDLPPLLLIAIAVHPIEAIWMQKGVCFMVKPAGIDRFSE